MTRQRYVGTFHFTSQVCAAGAPDALGRTLETHGPCEVNGFNSVDCDMGGEVPITQYAYWPSDASGNKANRLQQVSHLVGAASPSNCAGAT